MEHRSEGGLRTLVVLGGFVLAVLALVYWDYPFDGMVIEESWNLYTHPKDEPGQDLAVRADDVRHWLSSRRGGYNLVRLLLVSAGATPVVVNGLCIAAQIVNLLLFSAIVIKVAGRARLIPILMVALLYPFASSGHFWQVDLVHHIAITFFFVALLLFLRVGWDAEPTARAIALYGVPSLACFWLSLILMEHAILMPVLFLYLALYQANGRGPLVRFTRLRSPATACALCYCALSLAFVWVAQGDLHSRLNFLSSTHADRFQAWASAAHIPLAIIMGLVLGANAILFFSASAFANSVGYLGYPALSILSEAATFGGEAAGWMIGAGAVASLGAAALYLSAGSAYSEASGGATSFGFLLTVGLLWVLLSYFPLSLSFAYPRVVGQTADRINALAMFGVSLCLGTMLGRALTGLAIRPLALRISAVAGLAVAISLLLGHLRVQRDYWVEAYEKERKLVSEVLALSARERALGQSPVIILERERMPETVRLRLTRALQQPDVAAKLREVAKVVLARHFTEAGELEVTSFHLQGVPLFGGIPSGASAVFNRYARQLSVPPVPVYKLDNGATFQEDGAHVAIGYGHDPATVYSKRDYHLVVLNLEESFFRFRGSPVYRIRDGSGLGGS